MTEARQRHTELAEGIRNHENELRALKDEGYENTIAYAEAESRLDGLKQEYAANGEEVRKLEGQCNALQKTMQRNADAVSRAKTDLNNARAAVRETEAEIRRLSQQLKIQQSAWTQAGAALAAFSTKMTAIGKSATALGRRMTVMLTTPIVALGKKVVQVDALKESGVDTAMNGMDQVFRSQQSDLVGMIDDLTNRQDDLETVSNLALNLWQALSSGDLDENTAAEYAAQLQEILDLVSAADQYIGVGNELSASIAQGMQEYGWEGDATTLATSLQTAITTAMQGVGSDASAGVGQGLGEYDFSGDTATAASNLEGAYRGSLQSQSPAQRMVPLGNDVSAGVGQGMTQYSFAGDSSTAASNLMAALSAALSAQAATAASSARSIGTAISSGIASGISAGQSGVISAAVRVAQSAISAAKAALDIHSPSGVFREEVGLMAMKGMGEGFLEGQQEQAKIIRNAARYLTEEAQGGIIAGNTHNDNRQSIQQNSSVNLTGNSFYVRSDQDIHDLAVEIATLTRTQQRGRGLRMA